MMDHTDGRIEEILATWLIEKAEILPSRAKTYANLLVTAGIGSISRLSKKMKKCPSLLLDLGFDEDDAEEILSLLLNQESFLDIQTPKVESDRVLEARAGVVDYTLLRCSQILRPLCLESHENIISKSSIIVCGVGELILPQIATFAPPDQTDTISDMPLSESYCSLGATSFDRALETLDEKRHSISPQEVFETLEPRRKLPIRTSIHLNTNTLVMSKEHMEIASSALALVSRFAGYEGLEAAEVVCLLRDVVDFSERTTDKCFFLNCLSQLEICKNISSILSFFMDSTEVCTIACECISLLSQSDEDRKTINLDNIEEFGYYGTCDILSRLILSLLALDIQSANISFIRVVCISIAKLSHLEQNIIDFISFGVCDSLYTIVESCIKSVNDANYLPLVVDALVCARNLSQHINAVQRFLTLGFEASLCKVLLEYSRNELVSINAIRVIILIGHSVDGPKMLGYAGACNAVVLSMTGNDGQASVVEWALMAIEMLLTHEDNLPLLLQTSICEVLVYCLHKNLQVPSIARGAARVVQMLAADQIVRTKLGVSDACSVFSQTLSLHMKVPGIAQACCGAIGSLAADHEINRVRLLNDGAGKYILETMQRYSSGDGWSTIPSGSDTVIWQACWTLRKLVNGRGSTSDLEEAGICETLVAVGRRYIASTEIVIQLFRLVNALATQSTSKTLLHRIGQSGLCKTIVKCLATHSTNSLVSRIGVESLTYLACENENIEKLCNSRACEVIVEILENHSGSESDLVMFSCRALGLLAINEAYCLKLKYAGGTQALLWALQRQLQNENVVREGCIAMCKFLEVPLQRQFFGSNGACEIVVAALKSYHSNIAITEVCSRAIHFLALDTNNRAWLGASGGCHVIYSLKEHSDNPLLCAAVCSAVSSLSLHHDGNARRLCDINAVELIILVMKTHYQHEDLVQQGNYCLYCLAEYSDVVKILNQTGAISCILENLLYHKNQSFISIHGFAALSRLTNPKSVVYSLLLETNINSTMICLLSELIKAPVDVIARGLDVLDNLSAIPENIMRLGQEGICRVLEVLLGDHTPVIDIVKKITRIVMCISLCDENISILLSTSICDLFVLIMKIHKLDNELCSDICRVFFQLSLKYEGKCILSEPEEVVTILRHLQAVKDHEVSVLIVLQLLTIICRHSKISNSLIKANGIKLLSSTISQHINHFEIVAQGISVFSSIFCREENNDQVDADTFARLTAYETCETFGQALRVHGTDISLVNSILRLMLWITKLKISTNESAEKILESGKPSPPTKPLWKKFTSMFSSVTDRHDSSPPQLSGSSSPSKKKLLLDDDSHLLSSRLGAARICESVLQGVSHHTDNERIVSDVCELLVFLSRTEENLEFMQRANGCETLFVLFRSYSSNEKLIVLLCPILETLISFSVKRNSSLVISKSYPSNGHILCELGLSSCIFDAIHLFLDRVETLSLLLQLLYQLASSSHLNQSIITRVSPSCFETLLGLLSTYCDNSSIILKTLSTFKAILLKNSDNIMKLASIGEFSIFSKLLGRWDSEIEIIRLTFWILRAVGTSEIHIQPSPSQSIRQQKKRLYVENWLNTDLEDQIILYFIKYCKSDPNICQYGSDLLCYLVDSTPLDYSYFQSNEQIEKCQSYSSKGVTSVVASVLECYLSSEDITETIFLLAALLTRRMDNLSLRQYSPPGLVAFYDNLSLIQPLCAARVAFRALEKYPSHQGIIRSALFLLNNLIIDHSIQSECLSSLKIIWRAIQNSVQDPQALRYSCNLISSLSSIETSFQSKFISLGAIPVVLHAFRLHMSHPQTVHDAVLVIISLCNQNSGMKEKICSAPVCDILVDTLEAYSLNEFIAVEVARCIALLMEDAPTAISLKFNEKGLPQVIVGLLQSFGCGRESDQSAAVAEWCSRIIYCVATTPLSLITRSTSSTDSFDESDKRQLQPNWALQLGNLGASETLLLAIEKFCNRKAVLVCACKALLALSAERENVVKIIHVGASKVINLVKEMHCQESSVLSDYVNIILSRIDQVGGVEG